MSATIFNNTGRFGIKFYNPILKEQKHYTTCDTHELAESLASEIELEFYRLNTIYLPKGVYVGQTSFKLMINTHTIKKGNHKMLIASAKRFVEIKKLKRIIVNSFFD
jgi:hypothetical protein